MIKRWISEKLKITIDNVPAVALLGARQVGKTTLAKEISKNRKAIYLDLEAPEDLLKLSDAANFLSLHSDKLVIIDEIQRAPNIFMILRGLIDKNRIKGRKSSQYLLLGSASMDLLRQSSESLAGRISYVDMSGLNSLEIPNKDAEIRKLWLRGGFPDSYLSKTSKLSLEWLENIIRTYLERDVPQAGFRVPAARLRRLWTMLAHLQGENINFSKIASNLEIDGKTVRYYIDILVDLLLVRRLEPWHANVKKRLIKSPRFYIRDSGILHRLLGINDFDDLLSNPVIGKSWEGFVIENICSILPNSVQTYYYLTSSGAEIDLLIKFSSKELWAIEIKKSTAPKINKSYHNSAQDLKVTQKFIVYGGNDEFPIANNTTVISLSKILQKISNLM